MKCFISLRLTLDLIISNLQRCACGRSKTQPFCDGTYTANVSNYLKLILILILVGDLHFSCYHPTKQLMCANVIVWWQGSHAGTEFQPKAFKVEKTGDFFLCQCKQTLNAPFCDVRSSINLNTWSNQLVRLCVPHMQVLSITDWLILASLSSCNYTWFNQGHSWQAWCPQELQHTTAQSKHGSSATGRSAWGGTDGH
jgi:CDGSH-type Zn-finger protein